MLLYNLTVLLNKDISDLSSDVFRGEIISMTNHLEDEIKNKINFHITDDKFTDNNRKIPYILFANLTKLSHLLCYLDIIEEKYSMG